MRRFDVREMRSIFKCDVCGEEQRHGQDTGLNMSIELLCKSCNCPTQHAVVGYEMTMEPTPEDIE